MSYLRSALTRLAGTFTRDRVDNDLREEMEAHLEMEAAEYIRRGMAPEDARRQAMLASGGLTQAAEALKHASSDVSFGAEGRFLRVARQFDEVPRQCVIGAEVHTVAGASSAEFTLRGRWQVLPPIRVHDD